MRIWLFIFCVHFAWSAQHTLAANENGHGIVLTLSQTECQPGDVVELHAQMKRNDYAEFELKLPKLAALHYVAHQQSPITYSKGFYWQHAVWVFQPVHSGTIEWAGIRALIEQSKQKTEYELPPLQLAVRTYSITEDAATPEWLPIAPESQQNEGAPIWLYILTSIGGLAILYFALRREVKS